LLAHCNEFIQTIIEKLEIQDSYLDHSSLSLKLEIPYSCRTRGPTQKAVQYLKIESEEQFIFIRHRLIHVLHGLFLVSLVNDIPENLLPLLSMEKEPFYQWVT
jgi:hypothetical protein